MNKYYCIFKIIRKIDEDEFMCEETKCIAARLRLTYIILLRHIYISLLKYNQYDVLCKHE
jgi:hypothetical protein